MEKRLFTSESVTEGHPDKICDAVSDAVLDALMEQDPFSRVACETCTNTGFVLVMGEITTKANIDIPAIVRKTVTEIGYDSSEKGFDGIVHLKSSGCTPEIDVMPVLQRISSDYHIPILYLSYDSQTSDTGLDTRLEAFYDMLAMKKESRS